MPSLAARIPFHLPSGCPSVAIPEISVVDACSLPGLTSPLVSPTPIVFDVPQLPTPPVEMACIDIVPVVRIGYRGIDGSSDPSAATGGFRTEDGFDDCLEGRYRMSMSMDIPCVLGGLPENARAKGEWVAAGTVPNANLKFNRKAGGSCAVDSVSMVLNVPCPKPKVTAVVTMRTDLTLPTMAVTSVEEAGGKCDLRMSLALAIPAGCNAATYSVTMRLSKMDPKRTGPYATAMVSRVGGGNRAGCSFRMNFGLALGTAAFYSCPAFGVKNAAVRSRDDDGANSRASFHWKVSRSRDNCDSKMSFVLDLPKLQMEAPPEDVNVNIGDIALDIDNGGANIPSNKRSFALNLRLPGFICMPTVVETGTRVRVSEFLPGGRYAAYGGAMAYRHMSVKPASCIRKPVRIGVSSNGRPKYTMTCVTQCSREMTVSTVLPWWMYRARTVKRIPVIVRLGRGRFRIQADGDGAPGDDSGASLKIDIPDPPLSDGQGVGAISGAINVPCPMDMITMVGTSPIGVSRIGEGDGCSVRFRLRMSLPSAFSGNATYVYALSMRSSGLYENLRVKRYRKGILVKVSSAGARKVFGLAKCE